MQALSGHRHGFQQADFEFIDGIDLDALLCWLLAQELAQQQPGLYAYSSALLLAQTQRQFAQAHELESLYNLNLPQPLHGQLRSPFKLRSAFWLSNASCTQ